MAKLKPIHIKLLALVMALLILMPFLPLYQAVAETGGTVTVHFYNPAGYACDGAHQWGAYYWVSRADTVKATGVDEEFCNSKNNPDIKGITFDMPLTSNDVSRLKGGADLGLILVWAKEANGLFKPNWDKKDVNTDRMLKIKFDGQNNSHVYVIAGDKENYFSLDSAKTAFERIESAKFDSLGAVEAQTTGRLSADSTAEVIKHYVENGEDKEESVAKDLIPNQLSMEGRRGIFTLPLNETNFDMRAHYELKIKGYAYGVAIDKTRLFISPFFKQNYEPTIDGTDGVRREYGAIYSKESTTFRVWAPISKKVAVNLYRSGDPMNDLIYAPAQNMTYAEKGVWEATIRGDLQGLYYTYSLYTDGKVYETIDVNANSSGINGDRGYIFDMEQASPEGWEADLLKSNAIRTKQISNPDPIIWELHVRDFSIHPDSGIRYKGKYKAFAETGTTLKGNASVKTGIDHLKELGATYVHLLPVYDFDKVDESRTGDPSYQGKFNWGYDPKNYNVPEGSYSTDAYNGDVRVKEFKEMVMGLHDAGIGVIMDVVYNHTFSLNSPLNKTVPSYYYRQSLQYANNGTVTGSFDYPAYTMDGLGNYNMSNASGCGNETASEKEMFGQYMRNSIMHWARDYHIDGFRFDLMAIHNIGTMNVIREDLDKAFSGAGKGILMYGEPWAAAQSGLVSTSDPATWPANNTKVNVEKMRGGIKIFNDNFRNAFKGGNNESEGYLPGGYLTGQADKASTMLSGITGNIAGIYDPARGMTYTSAHDNYTLNDHLLASVMHSNARTAAVYSQGNPTLNRMSKLSAAIMLTSKGTPFILSGDEFSRTKYGNHNSYDSSDKVNALDYARKAVKKDLFDYYKGLIALRKSFSPFRDANGSVNMEMANYDNGGVIMYKYTSGSKAGDKFKKVAVIANPFGASYLCRDSAFSGWYIIGGDGYIDLNSTAKAGASFTVPAQSAIILAQK